MTFIYTDGSESGPTITSLSPTSGTLDGGNDVVITGVNLGGTTDVQFAGVSADITIDSDTQVTAVAPDHAPGPVTVLLITPDGTDTSTYTYTTSTPPGDCATPQFVVSAQLRAYLKLTP